MSGGVVSALGVAILAMLGTVYTAYSSRAAVRESAKVPTFDSITKRLDDERLRRETEVTELRRSQRMLLSYVRDLREAMRRDGIDPPPPPSDLDLSPWDNLA